MTSNPANPKPAKIQPSTETRHPERRDPAADLPALGAEAADAAVRFERATGRPEASPTLSGVRFAIRAKAWLDAREAGS